ncbi:hypothetical protein [Nocardia africana]|uniref:hypothetical protein n=1 Tax=Nocardia africana TaxID=134964 RepID=UPI000FE26BAB|nr:hypothetical protein [Nocardia africana]
MRPDHRARVYLLFFGDLFRQAKGQEMSVFVIGAIVMIVGFLQFKRLTASLDSGNEWVANRFALAIQNPGRGGGGGGGGGGGHALGMGEMGAHHKLGSGTMMAVMAGASTISNSPLTEWLLGALPGGFHPQSKLKKLMTDAQAGVWVDDPRFGGRFGSYAQSMLNRPLFARSAKAEMNAYGGKNSVMGLAAGLQGVLDVGGTIPDAMGALIGSGVRDEKMLYHVLRSRGIISKASDDESLADKDLKLVVAAVRRAQNSARLMMRGDASADEVAADFATLGQASRVLRRMKAGGVDLSANEKTYVEAYMSDLHGDRKERIDALQKVINGESLTKKGGGPISNAAQELIDAGIGRTGAKRMRQWIGNEHAKLIDAKTHEMLGDLTNGDHIRELRNLIDAAVDTDHWVAGVSGTPWNSVTPRGTSGSPAQWATTLAPVAARFK